MIRVLVSAIVFLAGLILINPAIAGINSDNKLQVDMYRSKQVSIEAIRSNNLLMNELSDIANIILSPESLSSEKNRNQAEKIMNAAKKEVSKLGDFKMVSVSPIMYPDNKTIYFTIDLVDQSDQGRLKKFMDAPRNTISDPDHLIDAWQKYEKTAMNNFFISRNI
jgi:hypothetical protein